MLLKFVAIIVVINSVLANPQLLSFKDRKIGVNFGGYHAEAGLGGLLTGNAAHGGLSASAGTPFGQQAGAGIGGSLNGRAAGGGYAGASAGYGVGASAAFGGGLGDDGGHGGVGAESHAGGISKKVVKLSQTEPVQQVQYESQPEDINDGAIFKGTISGGGQFNIESPAVAHIEKEVHVETQPKPYVQKEVYVEAPPPKQYVQKEVHVEAPPKQYVQKEVHVEAPPKQYVQKEVYVDTPQTNNYGTITAGGTINGGSTIENDENVNIVSVPVYRFHKHRKAHRVRPHKVIYQKTYETPQTYYNPPSFDYRKFFDFGFFSNTAAGFGGPHQVNSYSIPQQQQQQQRVVVEKEYVPPPPPQKVYETRVVPKVVYEKRIVPETITVEKTIQPQQNENKEVQYVNAGGHGGSELHGGIVASGGSYYNGGRTIFDDIFNIPIGALQGVNRLLNNKHAGGGIQFQKSIEVHG